MRETYCLSSLFWSTKITRDNKIKIDTADEIIKATLLTENGAVVSPALVPSATADAAAPNS